MIVHVLRKPLSGTVAQNALQHGCGALNIDGCRVSLSSDENPDKLSARSGGNRGFAEDYVGGVTRNLPAGWDCSKGRWPANLVHDGSDEVVETFPESNRWFNAPRNSDGKGKDGQIFDTHRGSGMGGGDSGSASRFFQQVTLK